MVKVEKGKKENNKIELTVTVELEKVQQEFNETYRMLSQKVRIPGFRSGRIPINILEMNLGKEYIDQQVAEKIVKDTYDKAINESHLDPIDVPKIDLLQVDKTKPMIYKMILEVKPEFEIPDLKDVSVEKIKPEVTEKEVEEDLERIRESHGKLKTVEGRKSKQGDFLVLDYETFVDGKPLPDGKKENQILQLGDRIPPEFNANLIEMNAGEEKEIKMKIPVDARDIKIAGKEIDYHVKISSIKERELPELNDDFAKNAGEYNSLDDLKEHIRKQLNERKKYQNDSEFNDMLLEKVAEKCVFDVPEVLIERQVENMMNNLKEDLQKSNMSLDDYYKMIKADENKVKSEYRTIAVHQIKKELIVDKIIQDGKITATNEDIENRINEIAESTNQKALKVRAMFEKNQTLSNLEEQIKREKALEILSGRVNIISK